MSEVQIQPLGPGLWALSDPHINLYLIAGTRRALRLLPGMEPGGSAR